MPIRPVCTDLIILLSALGNSCGQLIYAYLSRSLSTWWANLSDMLSPILFDLDHNFPTISMICLLWMYPEPVICRCQITYMSRIQYGPHSDRVSPIRKIYCVHPEPIQNAKQTNALIRFRSYNCSTHIGLQPPALFEIYANLLILDWNRYLWCICGWNFSKPGRPDGSWRPSKVIWPVSDSWQSHCL